MDEGTFTFRCGKHVKPFHCSSPNRNFLGTKETSLLLMAMFLLAVFYHGQQVRPADAQQKKLHLHVQSRKR